MYQYQPTITVVVVCVEKRSLIALIFYSLQKLLFQENITELIFLLQLYRTSEIFDMFRREHHS